MKKLLSFILFSTIVLSTQSSLAQMPKEKTVEVGGAPMYPSRNIIENAVNSSDHTTLVAAVKAAGLVETLQGAGPFTVFAPTNHAFDLLPQGTVENLVKPENKSTLTNILTYHVVPGTYNSAAILKMIKEGKGMATLKTVQGKEISFMLSGEALLMKDAKGGLAKVVIKDVKQSNGMIHVIDHVLLP